MVELNPSVPPALLVVVGASGAGKTTLVELLGRLRLAGVGCYHFDTIGIPSEEDIAAQFGDGERFQAWALDQWIARLMGNEDQVALAVLDAQVRPSAARDAFVRHRVPLGAVVLVDCDYEERTLRRRPRTCQPQHRAGKFEAGFTGYVMVNRLPQIILSEQQPDRLLSVTTATTFAGFSRLQRTESKSQCLPVDFFLHFNSR